MVYTQTDGYTYSAERVVTFYGESAEDALIKFEDAMRNAKGQLFKFLGDEYYEGEVDSCGLPDFYTLDEWFTRSQPETLS